MVLATLSLLLAVQGGPVPGYKWKVERSYRFLNETPKIDFTTKEESEYVVEAVDAKGISISQSRRFVGGTPVDGYVADPPGEPKKRNLRLGPGGAPTYKEDPLDVMQATVDRVQWSAAEDRAGVSWTRHFAASGELKGAKLTMKPTSSSATEKTVAITYLEDGGLVKGEATVAVALPERIVTSLKMTLNGVPLGSTRQPVKVAIRQQLVKQSD